jgi:GNAT superfamily N-acetyltransferase
VSSANIRPATASDSAAISVLLDQLGYPTPVEEIPRILDSVTSFSTAIAMVAEHPERGVVGLVTAHLIPSIHETKPVAWLTTLVVLDAARGEGVGSQLVSFVEDWAEKLGISRISVTSGKQRERAHRFYEERGYDWTGLRFTKIFVAPSPGKTDR